MKHSRLYFFIQLECDFQNQNLGGFSLVRWQIDRILCGRYQVIAMKLFGDRN
jgi:hypothetical protein